MHFIDHLIVLFLAVVIPITGRMNFKQARRVLQTDPEKKTLFYVESTAFLWLLGLSLLGYWWWSQRSLAQLGLWGHDNGTWVFAGYLLWFVCLLGLIGYMRYLRKTTARLQWFLQKHTSVVAIFPLSRSQFRYFSVLSCSAGLWEEILFRGYLHYYFASALPAVVAWLFANILFTLCHTYQDFRQLPEIFAIGCLFSIIYWLTGNLWPAILLHAAVDLLTGLTAKQALQQQFESE